MVWPLIPNFLVSIAIYPKVLLICYHSTVWLYSIPFQTYVLKVYTYRLLVACHDSDACLFPFRYPISSPHSLSINTGICAYGWMLHYHVYLYQPPEVFLLDRNRIAAFTGSFLSCVVSSCSIVCAPQWPAHHVI